MPGGVPQPGRGWQQRHRPGGLFALKNTTERGEFPFPERGAVHTGLASGGGSRMASLQALSLVAPPECLLRRRPGGRQQRH